MMYTYSYVVLAIIVMLQTCCMHQHGSVSYAQLDALGVPLDHKLLNYLNYEHGFFIEVGAYDGVFSSNTKLLEDFYGWRGILIEPSPLTFQACVANRPKARCFECALGTFQEDNTYAWGDFYFHPMASLVGRIEPLFLVQVKIRSLQSILDECNITHVNFFSLDTEGYELKILQGIDFERTTFDYMLIEVYTHQFAEIVDFLQQRGYGLVTCLSNYNKIANPGWDGTHNDYLFKRISDQMS